MGDIVIPAKTWVLIDEHPDSRMAMIAMPYPNGSVVIGDWTLVIELQRALFTRSSHP